MLKIIGFPEKGRGVGKELGFPTINFVYDFQKNQKIEDADFGVYAAKIINGEKKYQAAVNFGGRPTIDAKLNDQLSGENFCEAFVLNFDSDFDYNCRSQINLIKKIRDIKKFDSIEKLKEQIDRDVEAIQLYFSQKTS